MSDSKEWRHQYPWGKKAPDKRLQELHGQRKRVHAQKRLVKDRLTEKLKELDRQKEAIDYEITVAEKCKGDQIRRRTKSVAHQLLRLDIDVFAEIEGNEDKEETLRDLQNRLENAQRTEKSLGHQPGNSGPDDDGLMEDDIVSHEELANEGITEGDQNGDER